MLEPSSKPVVKRKRPSTTKAILDPTVPVPCSSAGVTESSQPSSDLTDTEVATDKVSLTIQSAAKKQNGSLSSQEVVRDDNFVTSRETAAFGHNRLEPVPRLFGQVHTKKADGCCSLCSLRVDKSTYLDPEPDAEEIPEPPSSYQFIQDMLPTGNAMSGNESELPGPEAFHGPEELQKDLKKLCHEFRDLFSSKIRARPAKVTPMTIEIMPDKTWRIPACRRSPRPQSPAKLAALKTYIEDLLRIGAIRPSNAENASQCLLVIKKNTTKLRFCIDFRELNDITKVDQWVIPNIGELLQRLGAKRYKYFAVMDLTQGYYQAPLSEASRIYTAFTSAFGIFEWCRVVMGLKGSGSYFQRMMVTEVLKGLIQNICESYLDDILVGGSSPEEYLGNLRTVFERFKAFNITLNPAKCRFGLTEVEYVGHVINQEGLRFTKEKIDSVIHFPCPQTHKDMLSFIGLANYFRAHVPNHSTIIKPLTDLTSGYKATKKIVWTQQAEAAFMLMKRLIDNCPKLYFQDPDAEIRLQTDASDYGLGAYLFQRIRHPDGSFTDQPIEFISKAFSSQQIKWTTNEKEAYAIFYTLRKLDYLLRDVKFLLQTDHQNLVYVNNEASPKVKRWKLALQEYNFDIEHIPGKENIIADAFSRLCLLQMEPTSRDVDISSDFEEFLGIFEDWDTDLTDYDGPVMHKGVEQFFSLEEEIAETKRNRTATHSKQVVEMTKEIHDMITSVHNAFAGHSGVRRTLAKLRKQGVKFDHMRVLVDMFIKQCPFCQKASEKAGPPAITLPFTLASYGAMNRLNIDSIGPLIPDPEGYQHILVVIDTFTRWIMLYPLKSLQAIDCLQALVTHFGTFGAPSMVTSDGGHK